MMSFYFQYTPCGGDNEGQYTSFKVAGEEETSLNDPNVNQRAQTFVCN